MKMNREQRNALIRRIQSEAEKKIQITKEKFLESFELSDEGKEKIQRAETLLIYAKEIKTLIGENDDYYIRSIISRLSQMEEVVTRNEKEKFLKKKKFPKYDFTNLETDLILSELDGISVEDIVSKALSKYKK